MSQNEACDDIMGCVVEVSFHEPQHSTALFSKPGDRSSLSYQGLIINASKRTYCGLYLFKELDNIYDYVLFRRHCPKVAWGGCKCSILGKPSDLPTRRADLKERYDFLVASFLFKPAYLIPIRRGNITRRIDPGE